MTDTVITVSFQGRPGDARDEACFDTIKRHGGQVTAGHSFMPDCMRDLEVSVPRDRRRECIEALRNKGFKVEFDRETPPFPRVVP